MNERNENEVTLHEKLCAYVLDEAGPEVRAEVEAALEASPELRAERARLESTIGLVQGALGDGSASAATDELSPAAAAALAAAAEAKGARNAPILRGPSHWYRSPVLKVAAGIGAVAVAFAAYQSLSTEADVSPFIYNLGGGTARPSTRTISASLEEAPKDAARERQLEAPETLEALGYTGDASSDSLAKTVDREEWKRTDSELDSKAEPVEELLFTRRFEEEQAKKDEAQAIRDRLRALGYTGEAAAAPASEATPEEVLGVDLFASEPAAPASAGRSVPGPRGPGTPGAGTPGAPASAPARAQRQLAPGAVVTGSDDFFLGHGEKNQPRDGAAGEVTGADLDDELLRQLRELGYVSDEPVLEDSEVTDGRDELRRLGYFDNDEHASLRRQIDFVLSSCQRRPSERPRDMFFRFWGDNPLVYTVIDGLSTFSVDVDTASYALARKYLAQGHLPEKAQVRTEEFVNYFDADVPAPLEETFRIQTELAPSRFGEGPDSWMLRVAVRGKDVAREERQPLTLTFVIDVSGSMKEGGRLELVKHALRLLLGQLDARDSIAIVAFSNEARVILPMTSAKHRSLIETAIHQLRSEGGTNAEAGLVMGYELAAAELTQSSHNRVVLLSDGVANIGRTDQQSISARVERQRQAGIYLNTVGVGMGNHNDALLEQLADKGDGICHYVDDEAEARRALVERFTGAFEPIARDVKIQVEFDPVQVQGYRLLGYENRAIADRDFRNDAVDAGEVNAGHQVVALYELQAMPRAGTEAPLATVRLRYKPPHAAGIASADTEVATEVERPVRFGDAAGSFGAASAGYRRSVLAGQFAEFLRRSQHARSDSVDELLAELRALTLETGDEDTAELARLVERSRELILAERVRQDDWSRALDRIRESCYLQAQLEDLNLRLGHDRLFELEDAVRTLQRHIALLRERVELGLEGAELRALELENARLKQQLERLLRELVQGGRRR